MSKIFPIASVATDPRMELEAALLPVRDILDRVPHAAIDIMGRNGICVRVLDAWERYRDASGTLQRRNVDVNMWPFIPVGLFVIEERTLYLRVTSPMGVAHELGHALDCAIGGGAIYRSSYDIDIKRAFDGARDFVTPHAQESADSFFAECFRAYIEVNEFGCSWPDVTRERLARCAPQMSSWFEREIGVIERTLA
jgi:hypothetical protein